MSDVSPESALALREAILDHDTWNENQPEMALPGFIALDGYIPARAQLPIEVRTRLGITDPSARDNSQYEFVLGRRHNRRYTTLSDMYATWPKGQRWEPSFVYDDYGTDAAYVRVSRFDEGEDVLLGAHYFVSARESFEPGQPPLCDVRVELQDHMPTRRRMIELCNSGWGILGLAAAFGIDPMTGKHDLDKPDVESDTDMWAVAAEAMGTPMPQLKIEQMRAEEAAAAEMRVAEGELQPLTTAEILGLAALVRQVETTGQC
jgi:hypothetical protein